MNETGSVDQRIEATRLELQRARLHAARLLDDAEQRRAQAFDEVGRLLEAPARLWMLRQRRRVVESIGLVRRPTTAVVGAASAVIRHSRAQTVGIVANHVLRQIAPLRTWPIAQIQSDGGSDAVRWLGPTSIGGAVRQALFAHPTSTVVWRATVEPNATFVVNCGLAPNAPGLSDALLFEVELAATDGSWSMRATRTLRPRGQPLDRLWRPLRIPLPVAAQGDIEVRLTTRLAANAAPDFAWAVWGEPRFVWRRRPAAIMHAAVGALRRDGLVHSVRRLSQLGTVDRRDDYRRWLAMHAMTDANLQQLAGAVASLPYQPVISVITPVHNTKASWLRACIESIRRQVYPHWELCLADDGSTSRETEAVLDEYRSIDPRIKVVRLPETRNISAASNAALDVATGDFIALLDHDDELPREALAEVAAFLNKQEDTDFIYSDEDKLDQASARCEPYFKPDWSPEHFLNFMYTNHLMVLRRSLVDHIGRFRVGYEGSQDYDLALRVISASNRVGHIPKVLYHWRKVAGSAAAEVAAKPWALAAARRALSDHVSRCQLDADVLDGAAPGLFRVKRRIRGNPLISIVLTTDDRSRDVNGRLIRLLPNVIRSIQQKTQYANYELVIVDNGRLSDESQDLLRTVRHRRASYQVREPFNFAHKLNFSASHAAGEHLVILNDDVEIISSEWLTALLEYSQDPAVGAVGAKLYFADGRLQHAGIVLGVCGGAAHVFHQAAGHDPGYAGSTIGPRNYSAVTGACLMTRRAVFHEVGGFNEALAIDFNDVDYCLRLRRAGYRIVFTPYAELYHYESGSHGQRTWNVNEIEYMRREWAEVLAADPHYNVNLTRDFPDYRLGE